jgi:hypothetical protein
MLTGKHLGNKTHKVMKCLDKEIILQIFNLTQNSQFYDKIEKKI